MRKEREHFWHLLKDLTTRARNLYAGAYEQLVELHQKAIDFDVMKQLRASGGRRDESDEVFSRAKAKRRLIEDRDQFLTWLWGVIALNSAARLASHLGTDVQTLSAFVPTLSGFSGFHDAFLDFKERVEQCICKGEELSVQWLGLAMEYGATVLPTLLKNSSVPVRLEMAMLDPKCPEVGRLDPNWPDLVRTNRNRLLGFLRNSNARALVTGRLFGYSEPPDVHGFSLNNRWYYISWAQMDDGEIHVVGPEGYFFAEVSKNERADNIIALFRKSFERFCQHELFLEPTELVDEQAGRDSGKPPTITFIQSGSNIAMASTGVNGVAFEGREGLIIERFAVQVLKRLPRETISFKELHTLIDDSGDHGGSASSNLRQILNKLNKRIADQFHCLSVAGYIVAKKRKGYYLTARIDWEISSTLKAELRQRYLHVMDPHVMAETQPNRDQKLQAQPKGKKRKKDE